MWAYLFFCGNWCHLPTNYTCWHYMKVLLPLIDEHARQWLLLQADLQQRCFFVYDSYPAPRGRDKQERKLLVDRAVKFLLYSPTSTHAPVIDSLLWHVRFLFYRVLVLHLRYYGRSYTLMWWRGRKLMLTTQRKTSKCSPLCRFKCSCNLLFPLYCDEGGQRVVHIFLYDFYIVVVFAYAVAMIVGSSSWFYGPPIYHRRRALFLRDWHAATMWEMPSRSLCRRNSQLPHYGTITPIPNTFILYVYIPSPLYYWYTCIWNHWICRWTLHMSYQCSMVNMDVYCGKQLMCSLQAAPSFYAMWGAWDDVVYHSIVLSVPQ